MEEPVRAYAHLRLTRAREDLDAARANIANGYYRAAVSRSYYAVFYMASAALFSQSIQRSKHSGLEAAFNQYLVKPGQIEPEFSRLYQIVRRQREEADYAEEPLIDEAAARQALNDAEMFVELSRTFSERGGGVVTDFH